MAEVQSNKLASQGNKATKKDIDDAFDALAAFLFERYRKHKEAADNLDN